MTSSRVRSLNDIVGRVRREFLEMPGLRLTEAQARRLWTLDSSQCRAALDNLIESGFLVRTPDGAVIRVDTGRLASARPRRPGRHVSVA
ncbi:MAG: hypothetical protein U0Q11_24960 [Vicinamibacterales bacterium]